MGRTPASDHVSYEGTRRRAYDDLRGLGFPHDAALRDSHAAADGTHRVLDKKNGSGRMPSIRPSQLSRFRVPFTFELKGGLDADPTGESPCVP